ncbi:hypothetical protein [Agromyces sp. GXQ0307]|uniref:hypothetical protein n=1 Tax=Agromyces sp. GXQ0307 TaxID=3377835 RepID=UPI00383A0AB8
MKTAGFPYPAKPRPWSQLRDEYKAMGEPVAPILAIIESVASSTAAESLAGFTSMADLIVIESPPPALPYDAVAVRMRDVGRVEIEHLSVTGRNDRITREPEAAVPLFWRFMTEKFGVSPGAGRRADPEAR